MKFRLFAHEVWSQCEYLKLGAADLEAAPIVPLPQARNHRAWYAIQGILISSGTISRILWGTTPEARDGRRRLRKRLAVTEDSPFHPRKVRNDFEHFDERVEKWLAADPDAADMMSRSTVSDPTVELERFHHYDPETQTVSFQDNALAIQPLIEEAERVGPIAKRAVTHWYGAPTPTGSRITAPPPTDAGETGQRCDQPLVSD
jgi:hypothetical protein